MASLALVGLYVHQKRKRRRIAKVGWGELWSRYGLRAVPDPMRAHRADGHVRGRPLSVWQEGGAPHGRDVVSLESGMAITLRRGDHSDPMRVRTGDPEFDKHISVIAPWRLVAAVFTPHVRGAVQHHFVKQITVRDGLIEGRRPAGGQYDAPSALATHVVALARALEPPQRLDQALLERLRMEVSPSAQRFWLHELQRRRAPLLGAAGEALAEASDPGVALLAAQAREDRGRLGQMVLDRRLPEHIRHEAFGALASLGRSAELQAIAAQVLGGDATLEVDALRRWSATGQGVDRLMPRVRHVMADQQSPPELVEALAVALLASRDARGAPAALQMLESPDHRRQAAVLRALGQAGRPEHLSLLAKYQGLLVNGEVRAAAQRARVALGERYGDVEGAVSLVIREDEGLVSLFDELGLVEAARSTQPLPDDDD